MNRRRAFWTIAGVTCVIAACAYAYWPRSPYIWYTSEPIGEPGIRVELLIHRGWEKDMNISHPSGYIRGYTLRPPDRPAWWPGFVRRWFPAQRSPFDSIMLLAGP